MVRLWCAFVGQPRDSFAVDIDVGQTIGDLKQAIKAKKPAYITQPWPTLQLFLAKKDHGDGDWLTENEVKGGVADTTGFKPLDAVAAEIRCVGLSGEDVGEVDKEEEKQGRGPVNLLVVLRGGRKRHPSNEWFAESFHAMKKRRVDEDAEEETRFFDMRGFPPLAHPKLEFNRIMERKAYVAIFAQLVQHAKKCFEYVNRSTSEPDRRSEPGRDSNLIVTGNPGTGKSRFFLYCIFQLIRREREDVKQLPPYELVLNYGNKFLKYDAASSEFVELSEDDVCALQAKRRVLRLVEGTSSKLVGWSAVSVLFAAPDVDGLRSFEKVDGITYIMPTWTLEELKEYNSVLPVNLKLAEDELVSRYDKFGGIPRSVFSQRMLRTETKLKMAINSFSALEVVSYCRRNAAVKENNYSDCVLQMVPTRASFRDIFHLDFQSTHIAEAVINKVRGESLAKVSEFAVHGVDYSESTAVIRGKMYELLCHKWFGLHRRTSYTLHLRSLCSTTPEDVTIPKKMETIRFAALDKLKLAKGWTYYRPTSTTFGALDAFIWDGCSKCYGLQMTLNVDHGIKAAPLNEFLKWMKEAGMDQFYFTFVVPSKIETSYRKQSARTATGAVSKDPGDSAEVGQFVVALDLVGWNE